MTETPSGYYSVADAIRAALAKYGPLSRADLVKASDVPRDVLAKSLYALKKHVDVIEEGELQSLSKTSAKAPESAQDAPEEAKVSIPTTPPTECVTGQAKAAAEEVPYDATVADVEDALVAHDVARSAIAKLLTDNCRMRDWIDAHKDSYDLLLADRAELHRLKDELRRLV